MTASSADSLDEIDALLFVLRDEPSRVNPQTDMDEPNEDSPDKDNDFILVKLLMDMLLPAINDTLTETEPET